MKILILTGPSCVTVTVVCTICSEGLEKEEVVGTQCGHLYHQRCLQQWIERDATCPQCRQKEPEVRRMYPAMSEDDCDLVSICLAADLDEAQVQLRLMQDQFRLLQDQLRTLQGQMRDATDMLQQEQKKNLELSERLTLLQSASGTDDDDDERQEPAESPDTDQTSTSIPTPAPA